MLHALVLICATATCTPETARVVARLTETFSSPVTCFVHGQAYIAETAIEVGKDEIVRVVCK